MRTPRHLATAAIAFLAIASTSAIACATSGAQPAGGAPSASSRKALRDACRDDYRRFCKGVSRGDGRIAACFEAHAAELSPSCRAALQAARGARAPAEGGAAGG